MTLLTYPDDYVRQETARYAKDRRRRRRIARRARRADREAAGNRLNMHALGLGAVKRLTLTISLTALAIILWEIRTHQLGL